MDLIRVCISLIISLTFSPVCAAQNFHSVQAKSPAVGTMFIYPERIPLKAGGFLTAERGLMFVPVNRRNEQSGVLAVEVYRFHRTKTANSETPPLFILNGGPGFPGLEKRLTKPGFFEKEIEPLLEITDVIVVGQRGIGSSKPNTLIDQSTTPTPANQAYDKTKSEQEFRQVLKREKAVWEQLGVDLQGLNVVEAAADVNDVREALGYKKITILGGSFGSHWGMAIMRQFPGTVARAVLHGMEGPNQTYDHPGWYWSVFARAAAEAEQDEDLKSVVPEQGLVAVFTAIVERANKRPFPVKLGNSDNEVLVDGRFMSQWLRSFSGGSGLKSWPAEVIKMHHGDFQRAAQVAFFRSRRRTRSLRTASFWMMDIGSGITEERLAEYESDPARRLLGDINWFYTAAEPIWNSDLGDAFRQNFETDIPTVIVQGTWDTKTPYENAVELAPFFRNGKLVTVKRGSHGAFSEAMESNQEFKQALEGFMVNGETDSLPEIVELAPIDWTVPKLIETQASNEE